MSRIVPLAILGGIIGGGVYLLTRPKKGAADVLPPQAPPGPPPAQAEIKKLAEQVAVETEKQQALKVQLDNLSAAAAKAPPAVKAQLEAAKVQLAAAAAQGAEKQKVLKAQLVEKAAAEVAAARKAEDKAAGGPMYPVGLEAKFSGKAARIKKAWQDGQGNWHYVVDLETGLPWPANKLKDKQISEVALRQQLAERGGIYLQPGQAYGQGIEIYRNGQGGYIEKAEKNSTGHWLYTVRGWPNPVTQNEILGILTRA
jgi:hypothetical protein